MDESADASSNLIIRLVENTDMDITGTPFPAKNSQSTRPVNPRIRRRPAQKNLTQEHTPAIRKQLISDQNVDLERYDDTATAIKQDWRTQGNTDIHVPPGAAKFAHSQPAHNSSPIQISTTRKVQLFTNMMTKSTSSNSTHTVQRPPRRIRQTRGNDLCAQLNKPKATPSLSNSTNTREQPSRPT